MLSRCRHDGTIPEVSEEELPQHFDIGKHAYVAKCSSGERERERARSLYMTVYYNRTGSTWERIPRVLEISRLGTFRKSDSSRVKVSEKLPMFEVSDSEMSSHFDSQSEGHMSDNDDTPLAELIRRRVHERSNSSDSDDDIPLVELKRKYRRKAERMREHKRSISGERSDHSDMEVNDVRLSTDDTTMDIDSYHRPRQRAIQAKRF
ncbi:hypothetical protein DPMN_007996 [Dreissena polymorpha]|uniref:Uncharacterized protein n=1 Tax=Dreissena polymorpha TaxID=45954 RepID=A0A9D4RWI3_DREPO|nr:hypothetical protein DPMN_007996 [Dreissena polymorpha]